MYEIVRHASSLAFLERIESFLLEAEDRHNLILGLAYGLAARGMTEPDLYCAVVRQDDAVVGCALRTPPHKLLLTDVPVGAASALVHSLSEVYDELPGVLGPVGVAETVAARWADGHRCRYRPGMEQRIYRLDRVDPPSAVAGRLRVATTDDFELAVTWGDGFARDTGVAPTSTRSAVWGWIEQGQLHVWDDRGPRSIAVAHGRTPNGVRIGYVYTPPEHRRAGYATACVAALSQAELEQGARFCVLYTDRSNPTSNSIYAKIGYRPIADVQDFVLIEERAA